MKKQGDTTTFDHVTQTVRGEELQRSRAVFLVQFDGEFDLWFSRKLDPTPREVAKCLDELREHYKSDWDGTGRVIPMLYGSSLSYDSIVCTRDPTLMK